MSSDEKQPYIDAANKAKRKKKLEKENNEESRGSSRKRTRAKKLKPVPKVTNKKITMVYSYLLLS